jgi:putative peptide zinc metalloprotease protein
MTEVRLHPLGIRRDDDEWIIGRVETGDFVSVPHEGMRAIQLLQQGLSVEAAEERLREETGLALDVRDFVSALAEARLVAAVDGVEQDSPEPARQSLSWLRPAHVRWTLHPALHIAVGILALCALAVLIVRPETMPGWRSLLWSEHNSLILLVEVATGLTLVTLHELGHLFTARAAGVPGRITFGTRLQFLVMQTDVSAVWLAERRVRYTVYLAGMAVDVIICSICILLIATSGPGVLLSVILLTEIGALSVQLLVFMRTDVYFLVQDITRCRNMYGDAAAYLRYLLAAATGRKRPDPLAEMKQGERRSLRVYTLFMVVGTAVCVAFAIVVTVPLTVALLTRAAESVARPQDLLAVLDGVVTLVVVGGSQALWARLWWRRHGARVRRAVRRMRPYARSDAA